MADELENVVGETPVSEIPYPEGTAPPVHDPVASVERQRTLAEAFYKAMEQAMPEAAVQSKEMHDKGATLYDYLAAINSSVNIEIEYVPSGRLADEFYQFAVTALNLLRVHMQGGSGS
jgi:hypothetical protein